MLVRRWNWSARSPENERPAPPVGSVWLGTWPQQDRVARQAALFGLPEFIVPHSILALGYPESSEPVPLPALPDSAAGKWEADRVHWELW